MKQCFTLLLLLTFSISAFSRIIISDTTTGHKQVLPIGDTGKVYNAVDQFPEFEGGASGLARYLSENVKYPEDARMRNKQGKVLVKFVVCTDVSLCDEQIIKSVNSSIDAEVLRVVKAMPSWKAGMKNGVAVKTSYMLPVTFKFQGQEKDTLPDARDYLLNEERTDSISEENKIYVSVQQVPEFPGGMKGMLRFLVQHVQYPEGAKAEGTKGRVVVQFVVEKDGSLTNILVQRALSGGCSEEAVRVIKLMPKWKPAIHFGKTVRVYYTLPINFQM
jgi:TonB family protein